MIIWVTIYWTCHHLFNTEIYIFLFLNDPLHASLISDCVYFHTHWYQEIK